MYAPEVSPNRPRISNPNPQQQLIASGNETYVATNRPIQATHHSSHLTPRPSAPHLRTNKPLLRSTSQNTSPDLRTCLQENIIQIASQISNPPRLQTNLFRMIFSSPQIHLPTFPKAYQIPQILAETRFGAPKKVKRVRMPTRHPRELYEIPKALQATCSDIHLETLTLDLKAVPPRELWEGNIYLVHQKIRRYQKPVDTITSILVVNLHDANAGYLATLFNDLQFHAG